MSPACRRYTTQIMFCDTGSLVTFLTFTFKQTLEPQCFSFSYEETCCLANLIVDPFNFVNIKRHAVASFPGLSASTSLIACSTEILWAKPWKQDTGTIIETHLPQEIHRYMSLHSACQLRAPSISQCSGRTFTTFGSALWSLYRWLEV